MRTIIKELKQLTDSGYKSAPIGCDATNVFLADGRTLQEYISTMGFGGTDDVSDKSNTATSADGTDE